MKKTTVGLFALLLISTGCLSDLTRSENFGTISESKVSQVSFDLLPRNIEEMRTQKFIDYILTPLKSGEYKAANTGSVVSTAGFGISNLYLFHNESQQREINPAFPEQKSLAVDKENILTKESIIPHLSSYAFTN